MASTFDELARLAPSHEPTWRQGFAFGASASWGGPITQALVSLVVLSRRDPRDERTALAPTLAKLVVWIVAGVAATSIGFALLGALALRIWTGAFG